VVQLVLFVVGEKELESILEELFIFGIAESAANEHGRAIAHVGGNHFPGKIRAP